MAAYYNEIDPYAAEWLRNLIKAGHIAPGVVDERSIEDVKPAELLGYTQCHFFAGVGVWSLALRRAGWPDNRPIWTGSCPCQPFSAAGKGAGFADERHLWPAFNWLIEQCRPPVVFGEQVASSDAGPWLDLVQADLEAMEYAFGAVPFPSAGVGAPHIRDRLFWVADSEELRREGEYLRASRGLQTVGAADYSSAGRMGDSDREPAGRNPGAAHAAQIKHGPVDSDSNRLGNAGGILPSRLANPELQQRPDGEPGVSFENDSNGRHESSAAVAGLRGNMRPAPVNGLWSDADWLFCRDGKWRPVEPGAFPLANGAASRVGRLRAYGNAINAEAAKEFIAAYMQM